MTRNDFLKLLTATAFVWSAPAHADSENSGSGGGGDNSGKGGDGDDDGGGGGGKKDRYDSKKGNATKLKSILRMVKRRYPGEVASVKYVSGANQYRVKILRGDGKLITCTIDAASAAIVKVTGD